MNHKVNQQSDLANVGAFVRLVCFEGSYHIHWNHHHHYRRHLQGSSFHQSHHGQERSCAGHKLPWLSLSSASHWSGLGSLAFSTSLLKDLLNVQLSVCMMTKLCWTSSDLPVGGHYYEQVSSTICNDIKRYISLEMCNLHSIYLFLSSGNHDQIR